MRRCLRLLSCVAALGALAATVTVSVAAAAHGSSSAQCAEALVTSVTGGTSTETAISAGSAPAGAPGGQCWAEVPAYPFGSEGTPVNTASPECEPGSPEQLRCYLTVTSMAFRAWNRGLAATEPDFPGVSETAFGVWIFNGSIWYPAPGFPGSARCPGHTVLWAGKKDFWLIGGTKLCRFDGLVNEWEQFEVPSASTKRLVPLAVPPLPAPTPSLTTGACFAYNNCWFFGSYGTVVHWNGLHAAQAPLADASPPLTLTSVLGEYTDAVAREGPGGEPLGVAVAGTSSDLELGPLSIEPGSSPVQMYNSTGHGFGGLAFTPFTIPATLGSEAPQGTPDPYRTDLVAVDFDSAGQGWVAGNPAGLRLKERNGEAPRGGAAIQPQARRLPESSPLRRLEQPAPLEPVSSTGAPTGCPDPPPLTSFTYSEFAPAGEKPGAFPGAFLWSSIAVLPDSGEALAGGQMRRARAGVGMNEDAGVGEPAIAHVGCEGTATVTRFRAPDSTSSNGSEAPSDREGGVTAIVASAPNDAWSATSKGTLTKGTVRELSYIEQVPHLYRLTDGRPHSGPEANDEEPGRGPEGEEEEHVEPPAPQLVPVVEVPVIVKRGHSVHLPPAIYAVKATVHTTMLNGRAELRLYLTFRVRRSVTVGAQALRHGHVVSSARPKRFTGRTGVLILRLSRNAWPTKVKFVA